MPVKRAGFLRSLGPGLALAATGVGAGDLLAALVAGATFGEMLGWAIALGALLKLALNEALARWQLATDTTLLYGFTDDIVIRVRPEGGGSVVDLRSVSRVGQSDLGTNAARRPSGLLVFGAAYTTDTRFYIHFMEAQKFHFRT